MEENNNRFFSFFRFSAQSKEKNHFENRQPVGFYFWHWQKFENYGKNNDNEFSSGTGKLFFRYAYKGHRENFLLPSKFNLDEHLATKKLH